MIDPSPDEARSLLRRELVHPEYHETNVIQRLLDWIGRLVDRTVDAASSAPPVTTFAAMVAFLLLVLALGWLLSRARRTARASTAGGAVVEDATLTADQLRARAKRALIDGRAGDAVVDGFRALAVRQAERGYVENLPGATAHEVATAVGAAHPSRQQQVASSAALFDAVRYGDRPATSAQAGSVLELDDALRGRP